MCAGRDGGAEVGGRVTVDNRRRGADDSVLVRRRGVESSGAQSVRKVNIEVKASLDTHSFSCHTATQTLSSLPDSKKTRCIVCYLHIAFHLFLDRLLPVTVPPPPAESCPVRCFDLTRM